MAFTEKLTTHQKALRINLDPTSYGSFAEIGAGQEVARWFLVVGGASGTVAKSISAYDKEVSDDLYGSGARHVSGERLRAMLDSEWAQLTKQLSRSRGSNTRFFSFVDTISARNYSGTNEPHGWVGLRFQLQPEGQPNDIVLHINLRDASNPLEQEAVGILGVNLICAVFYQLETKESLFENIAQDVEKRIEIDYVEVLGPAFAGSDQRAMLAQLVRAGLAEAVCFPRSGPPVPPIEVLHKKAIVLAPGSFEHVDSAHAAIHNQLLASGIQQLRGELAEKDPSPVGFFSFSAEPLREEDAPPVISDLLERIDALHRHCGDVLLFRERELYGMTTFVNRYTKEPIRFVLGLSLLVRIARRQSGNIHWDHVVVNGVAEHHAEGKYFIEWREDGARRRRSVGTVPSEVLAEAQRQRALLDAKAAGVEVADGEDRAATRQLLVPDAVDRYLRDIKMNKAASTYNHYRHSLTLFKKSLSKATIDAIDRDDLMDFQEFLYKQGLSARTVKHKTIIIASFLKSVGVQKLLRKGDWPRYTEEDPESYTPEELQKFFDACSPGEYLLFQFFLQSGLRDAEVRHAIWSDLDFEHGIVKVKHKEANASQNWSFDPKGRRGREIPLPDFLMDLLSEAKKKSKSKLIFPSKPHSKAPNARPGGKPSDEFLEYCKAIALRASLNCGDCENAEGEICAVAPCCDHFYLHKFRATFATMHLQSGVDIVTVSRWLGHKDIKTTMRYLTAARGEDVRKKVNAGLLASSFSPQAKAEQTGRLQKVRKP